MPDEMKPLTEAEVDVAEKTEIDAGDTEKFFDRRIIADWRRMNTALQKIVEGPCCRMPNCRPDDPACNKAIAREAVGKAG